MYNFNNQGMINQLMRQKDSIDNLINQYSQPPVQNIINTGTDFEARILKEGEHWTLKQTNQVKNQYGFMNINEIDFWLVMNMAYNDYKEIFRDNLDMYARFSYAFINDPDAKQGKVFKYFT